MNMFRDLPAVADLIELCFANTLDNDGQRYIADMRRASRDDGFLKWASHMTETASLPLTGYVWEENGRVVGNASLIPFRDRGRRIYLIANIAVHPEYRRRGIARVLTQRAMKYGWDKKSSALWLHVRDDNPGAIHLYQELGFQEIARRTTWTAKPDSHLPKLASDIQVVPRHPRFWPQQQDWLRRLHPDTLGWYGSINFNSLRPGLMNWLYLLFVDMNIKQWAAVRGDQLLATLSWTPHGGRSESLVAATDKRSDPEALTQLLLHARRVLSGHSKLSLEHPAGEMTEAFLAAGFSERRTLLWMRADPATQRQLVRS
jgi:ribosomal protein S18 acetylase RimI-like enzyme